jgi:hypothetical protein
MGGSNLGKSINKPQKARPWSPGEGGETGAMGRRATGGLTPGTQRRGTLGETSPFWKGVSGEEKPYEPPQASIQPIRKAPVSPRPGKATPYEPPRVQPRVQPKVQPSSAMREATRRVRSDLGFDAETQQLRKMTKQLPKLRKVASGGERSYEPPQVQIKEQQIKQIKQLSKERLIEAFRKVAHM